MVKNFTQNDLVRFLYREVSFQQHYQINRNIENDWDVFQEYKNLRKAKKAMPKVTFHPAPKTISNLLAFSTRSNG